MNKTERKFLAARLAEESIVLLKNDDGLLPLAPGQTVAVFGRAQIGTLVSGNGSGGANVTGCETLLAACEAAGLVPEPILKGFYEYKTSAEPVTAADEFDWTKVSEMVNSGVMYEIFGRYRPPLEEYEVPDTLLYQVAERTDTALLVLGRNAGGEECDRHQADDYQLTPSEQKLVAAVCAHFAHVAVVLNTNGLIDLAWTRRYPAVQALLFAGIPGEAGAGAVARVLTGAVNPSGRLAFTIPERYEDLPCAAHFSPEKDGRILTYADYGLSASENGSTGFAKSPVTVYAEGLYNGYRYFTTFQKPVLYPFGYGLSYTEFALAPVTAARTAHGVQLQVPVRNQGQRPGRQVVQVYLASPAALRLERPARELKAFAKTHLLAPGETETLTLTLSWRSLAVYEETAATWVLEAGFYQLLVGTSSCDAAPALQLEVATDILFERCRNRLGLADYNRGKLRFLSRRDAPAAPLPDAQDLPVFRLEAGDFPAPAAPHEPAPEAIPAVLRTLSDEQLAALCVGYGPGTPFAAVGDRSDPPTLPGPDGAPLTVNDHPTGYDGYVSPAIPAAGIHSIFYKDGPAGVGGLAWPTEMLLACSFDQALWQAFGDAVGSECEERGINIWLAPAVNLHRNPLCGRNFEYWSEDPLLTARAACAVTQGVQQQHPVLVCAKHMAANEQETFRRGSAHRRYDAVDSILPERVLRELYLLPFEALVRQADLRCVMTAFNKINGTFAAGSRDLCIGLLRAEWGFAGAVVTDWGDMDIVVDGADAVAAGNDIVMPGGPPVIAQILQGLQAGRISRQPLLTAAGHLLALLKAAGRSE